MPDNELIYNVLNFASLETFPNLLTADLTNFVSFNTDVSYFKFIMPGITQAANLFIMKSELRLEDNIYDIFDH